MIVGHRPITGAVISGVCNKKGAKGQVLLLPETRIRGKARSRVPAEAKETLRNAAGFPMRGKFSTVRQGLDGT
jgi:hypothetical protein